MLDYYSPLYCIVAETIILCPYSYHFISGVFLCDRHNGLYWLGT